MHQVLLSLLCKVYRSAVVSQPYMHNLSQSSLECTSGCSDSEGGPCCSHLLRYGLMLSALARAEALTCLFIQT